jgi:hypothetical protein
MDFLAAPDAGQGKAEPNKYRDRNNLLLLRDIRYALLDIERLLTACE